MRFDRFTYPAKAILKEAGDLVYVYGHDALEVEHLCMALLRQDDGLAQRVLLALGIDPAAVVACVDTHLLDMPALGNLVPNPDRLMYSSRMARLGRRAEEIADRLSDRYIDIAHLLLAVVTEGDGPSFQALQAAGVDPAALIAQVKALYRETTIDVGQDIAQRLRSLLDELIALYPEITPADYRVIARSLEKTARLMKSRAADQTP